MQDLTITRTNGNIVRSLAGEDHISGLVFYSATLPTADEGVAGFTTTDIGAYAAEMGGVDIIVFTGGVGENQTDVRENVCAPLKFIGVEIDKQVNDQVHGTETIISTPQSRVKVVVVPTDEELTIARDTKEIVSHL